MTTDRSRRTVPYQRQSSKDQLQRRSHHTDRLQSPTTHTSADCQSHRADQAKIDSNAARSRLRCAIWWIFFFLGFVSFVFLYDQIWWIFFLGFVSFVFLYWWMILYICLAAEKMCATSRKCVFYVIFKNTTKYHKIFFKTFFEMQPNTWKYFPFLKIALFSGKYFTWTKHSLNS